MTISNYLFLIRKRLFGARWMLYFNIVVSSLAMALLCGAAVIPQILRHSENQIKRALADDMSKFGVISNSGSDLYDQNLSGYLSDIYHAPEIAGVGAWTYFGFGHLETADQEADYWNKILEIQNSHIREFDESPDEVQLVYMPAYAFQINRLELYSGSDEQVGSNTGYLMYLGYHFRDIPIGTVFRDEKDGTRYTVAGILKEDSSIVYAQPLLWNMGGLKLSCSVEMDNMVLLLAPCNGEVYFYPDYFFKCADGYTYEEAAAKIKEISEEYHIQAAVGTLQKRVRDVLSDANWLSDGITKLSAALFPAAFIMLLATQMLTIMMRKDELGVWLLSGMGKREVFRILLGENIVKTAVSALIAYGVVSVYEKMAYASAGISASVIHKLGYISRVQVPVFLLACAVLTALLCSVIPTVYVGKRSIPDIVRGTWR